MSNTIGGATIELGVDATRVDSGLDHVDSRVDRTGRNLQNLGSQGRRSLESIADGGTRAAAGIDTSTRNITQQLQRAIAAFSAGKKSGSEFFEELARRRGSDLATLTPLLAQLRELEAAQLRTATSAHTQAEALRAAAQAQTKSDSFIASLREQAALYGKSADEVLRYRAAQAGAAGAAEPLIQELARLKAAQEAVSGAASAAAQAQQLALQAQTKSDNFVAGLREQVALYGKSADEVLRYRAAQAGAAGAAEPLIQELARLKAAEDAVTVAARAAAQAQQQAAQVQATSDSFIAGLREQVALYGKSADEVMRYRAAQAGAVGAAEPLIQELARLKTAEEAVAAAARAAAEAQQQAVQVQAKSDNFVAGLREQVALYGKSADEVMRYRAAQAGAVGAAEPLIQELARLKTAEEAVAAAARGAAEAQQQAVQVQAKSDSFIAGLREQVALYGKSADEAMRYRAAQAGAVGAAEPLIQELTRLKVAEDAVALAARAAAEAQQQAVQVQAKSDTFIAGLREQVALYGKSAEEVMRYRAAQAGAVGAAEPLIQELVRLKTAEDAVATAARAAALAQQQAVQVQAGRDNFINDLQQQAAAIGKTRTELLELKAAQMGVASQAAPLIAQLRAQEQGLNRTGMSAGAMSAALRGIPAQFTDIVTSIQGGQPVLTVLLQQGGQLKDMFGGALTAAKALGGYVIGMVNPYTVVAAAVAVLSVAYVQGTSESVAYRKALIASGNAAGTTAGQLGDMARNISRTVGTQGAAAEALIAIVGTGKVAAANVQNFSMVAIEAQRALGKSVEDTAADFAELGKTPAAALLKLNEQYHFLTAEVYSQVKALEMQGRTIEAANIAQTAYAAGAESMASKVAANLGTLSKAWLGIKDMAKGAWDAMLDVGRETTLDDKLADVQAKIAKASLPGASGLRTRDAQVDLKGNLVLERLLLGQIKLTNEEAEAQRKLNLVREAGNVWAADAEKFASRQDQRDLELDRVKNQAEAAGIKDQEEIEKRLAFVRKKYADVYNLSIDQQIAKIKSRGEIEEERAKRSAMGAASAHAAGLATSLTAEIDYATKVAALDQAAMAREKSRLQQEMKLTAGKPNSPKELAALDAQIDLIKEKSLTRQKELQGEIFEMEVKNTRQAAINMAELAGKRADETAALEGQLLAQRDANALIGVSASVAAEYNRKLIEEAAVRKELDASILDTIVGREADAESMRASAARMRTLFEAQQEGIIKSAQLDKQKKVWESIEQTAHDTFLSIFDSGKSVFDRLRDTLKNGLLDLLYQMTIKKWIFNIGAQVSGFSGIGGMAAPAGGAAGAGGLGQVGSLLQTGKGIYDAISTGFTGLSASLGSGIASIGTTLGATSVQGFGMGLGSAGTSAAGQAYWAQNVSGYSAGAASAPFVTAAAGIAAGVLGGNLISGQYGSKNTVYAGTAAGAAIGSVVPVLGTAIGAALGGILGGIGNRLFGMGNKKASSQGVRGTLTADGFDGENYASWTQKGGWFRSNKSGTDTSAVDAGVSTIFTDTYAKLKTVSADFAKTLGADITSLASRSQRLDILLTQDAEANKTAIATFFGGVADTLAKELVPSLTSFAAEGETASATLQRLAGDYKSVDSVLLTIGRSSMEAFGTVGVASISARERLIAAAGGLDQLASGTAYFAQNFLSPEEQMKPIIENVRKQLADLGLAGVGTTDQFKVAVLDMAASGKLATEAGAAQYAALLQLAPQFKQMTDYTDSLADSTKQAAAQLAELGKGYESDIRALERSLMSAAQARAADVAGMDVSTLKLYERREALQAEVAAVEQAKEAAAQLAELGKGYESDIQALERSLMSVAQARAADVAGMDVSTLKLYERREALQAEVAAVEQAKEAQLAAIEKVKEAQLAVIEKVKAAAQTLRSGVDVAFSSLTASVNAEKEKLLTSSKAQTDLVQKQIDAVTSSIGNLTSLAGDLRNTLGGIELPGQEAAQRKGAQSQIAAALASAKAGGPLPPAAGLKTALGVVGKDSSSQFSSYLDYQRDLYRTANDIAGLADLTEAQLTNEEKALALAQKQKDIAQMAYEAEVSRLDSLLTAQKDEIARLDGINTTLLTIPKALTSVADAIAAALKNPVSAAPSTTASAYQQYLGRDPRADEIEYWKDQATKGVDITSSVKASDEARVQALYATLLGRAGEPAGVKFWEGALASGQTLEQVKAAFLASAEYKKLHPFAVGTNYVPRDMPAYIHEGEAIIPAADNRQLMARLAAPEGNNVALMAEVIRLREVVEKLQAAADRTATSSAAAANTLIRATQGRDSFVIREDK